MVPRSSCNMQTVSSCHNHNHFPEYPPYQNLNQDDAYYAVDPSFDPSLLYYYSDMMYQNQNLQAVVNEGLMNIEANNDNECSNATTIPSSNIDSCTFSSNTASWSSNMLMSKIINDRNLCRYASNAASWSSNAASNLIKISLQCCKFTSNTATWASNMLGNMDSNCSIVACNIAKWTSNSVRYAANTAAWSSNLSVWTSNALNNIVNGCTKSSGSLVATYLSQGTTQATYGVASKTFDIPGCTATFTTTQDCSFDMFGVAVLASTTSSSAQGVAYLTLDGVIVDSKYWSVSDGHTLENLPGASVLRFTKLAVPAGTHTVKLRAKSWTGNVIVNNIPTISLGYQPEDFQCMKSTLQVNLFAT